MTADEIIKLLKKAGYEITSEEENAIIFGYLGIKVIFRLEQRIIFSKKQV